MIKVGVLGFGFMGQAHANVVSRLKDARVVAVADADPLKLKPGAKAVGNIASGAGFDIRSAVTFPSLAAMLKETDLDIVDICVPTPFHRDAVLAAAAAGRHVLCEKPMARDLREADDMIRARDRHRVKIMIAQCIRFWPEYVYLADLVKSRKLGRLRQLRLQRIGAFPQWAAWYKDGKQSGGAALDLHIHDVDFVNVLLGMPDAIFSVGKSVITDALDIIYTVYEYKNGPAVCSEGSLALPTGFNMGYHAAFDKGILEFDLSKPQPFVLKRASKKFTAEVPQVRKEDGWFCEIEYFIDSVRRNREPKLCTLESTRDTLEIALAECRSASTGRRIALHR